MSDTATLVKALRILARDIESGDGVANAAIAEAVGRLEEQQERIRLLISERNRAQSRATEQWKLRDEFASLLGVQKVEAGVNAVKKMKERIKRLEKESESRWKLAEAAVSSCAEQEERIKRLVEAGEILSRYIANAPYAIADYKAQALERKLRIDNWNKAKEAKP